MVTETEKTWTIESHLELLKGNIDTDNIENGTPLTLPAWFDQQKYERGQHYFNENFFGMFISKLSGLLAILAIPEINQILMITHRSSTPAASFKRYLDTISHMLLWYRHPIDEKSWTWKSLQDVLNFHKDANRKGQLKKASVSQASLAITQFGFMGFALTKPHLLGIDDSNHENIAGFVHFWRVIGHMIGIEERYNICRPCVKETQQLCNAMLEEIIAPSMKLADKDFVYLSKTMLEGVWAISPMTDVESFANFVRYLAGLQIDKFSNWYSYGLYYYQIFICETVLKTPIISDIVRQLLNRLLSFGITATTCLPLLAHFAFGIPLRSRTISY